MTINPLSNINAKYVFSLRINSEYAFEDMK